MFLKQFFEMDYMLILVTEGQLIFFRFSVIATVFVTEINEKRLNVI